jgi:hypothetical protein
MPPMRSLSLLFLAAGLCMAGCDAGVQCVVDTDCPLDQYCSAAGACLPLGTAGDGGRADVGTSDGGPRDAMVSDARTDTRPVDAPVTCPEVAGPYTVGAATGCTVAPTMITVSGPGPSECAYEIALDATSAGTLAQDADVETEFGGMLSIGGTDTACTATFVVDTSLSLTCGACVIDATFAGT